MTNFNNCSIALLACLVFWGCSTAPGCPFDRFCDKCEKITVTAYLPPVVTELNFQDIHGTNDQVMVKGGYQHTLSVDGQIPELEQQPLQTLALGLSTIPDNALPKSVTLYFGFDSLTLANEELVKLDKFVQDINKTNLIQIRIEGHTDSTGSIRYNEKLSIKRAESVQESLLQHGVEKAKISLKGFGESQPLEPNDTEAHRAHNRRVILMPETEH
jgi:outer membrane protein OmpA-like peptidoglycan-associated protein